MQYKLLPCQFRTESSLGTSGNGKRYRTAHSENARTVIFQHCWNQRDLLTPPHKEEDGRVHVESDMETRLGPAIAYPPCCLLRERSQHQTALPNAKSANTRRSLVSLFCSEKPKYPKVLTPFWTAQYKHPGSGMLETCY